MLSTLVDADMHKAEPAEDLHKRPGQAFLPLLHEVRSHKAVPVWVSAASRLVHPSPEHKAGGCGRVVSRDGGEVVSVHHSKWLSSLTFKSFRFNFILIFFTFFREALLLEELCPMSNSAIAEGSRYASYDTLFCDLVVVRFHSRRRYVLILLLEVQCIFLFNTHLN